MGKTNKDNIKDALRCPHCDTILEHDQRKCPVCDCRVERKGR